jgi:hypothetical protein
MIPPVRNEPRLYCQPAKRSAHVRTLPRGHCLTTLAQARRFALSLPGTVEQPHFDRTSFCVAKKIYATALPDDGCLNVFVGDEHREPMLAMHPDCLKKLLWGGKVVGLTVALPKASSAIVRDLLQSAWKMKAPKSLLP